MGTRAKSFRWGVFASTSIVALKIDDGTYGRLEQYDHKKSNRCESVSSYSFRVAVV